MIEQPDAVCDVIVRNREIAEDTARLAPDVWAAAGAAGLWVLAAAKEVGGPELPRPDRVPPTIGPLHRARRGHAEPGRH
jgi:hypothetical protein